MFLTCLSQPAQIQLNLGLRISDARRVGPRNVVKGWLTDFEPQKTSRTTGMKVTAPIAPDLAAAIKAMPIVNEAAYMVTNAGQPHKTAKSLGNYVRDWCDQAGLPDCSSHGLRKACLTRLANLGLDTRTIMGLSGHTSEKEVQTYVDAYNRAKAAERAVTAIDSAHRAADVPGRKGNKRLSNRRVQVDKPAK